MLILFVDDDPDDYDIFCDALRSARPEIGCLHLASAQAAIDLLNDGDPILPGYIFFGHEHAENGWKGMPNEN